MRVWALLTGLVFFVGCAAPLRTSVAPFRPPTQLPNAQKIGNLVVAAEVLDTPEKSKRVFGTDLAAAGILPVQLVVENRGNQEYEIDAAQIFGVVAGEYYPAFNLSQAAQRVRESSIGTTVVGQAVLGALAGAMAGAAIGAAAGSVTDDAGRGAAAGAAIGGAAGGTAGAAEGASDRYTHQFRHELAAQDFGDRVIFPGDLHQGFIYLQWQPYTVLRVKVTNITERTTHVVELPITVTRRQQ
ncbi:MAG: hypothetical protein KatS3mg131_0300 [Candidatus Tectimicrobiota bacterium]|nr:MAG: hypothetical protein KatS3mg131_0300 [Candidatus Tectomicrobia bacterium]